MQDFRNIQAWQKAHELTLRIYKTTKSFPKDEMYGLTSQIMEVTAGRGVDYAVEAAGLRQTMEQAFLCVRDHGGLCVLAGNLPLGETISLDPFDLIKGKQIIGTWGGETDPDRDIEEYVQYYLADKLKLNFLASHISTLDDINQALDSFKSGNVNRVLIDFS